MKLPVIPQDKANHFIYGAAVGLASVFALRDTVFAEWFHVTPILAAGVLGVAKEALDYHLNKKNPGTYSVSAMDVIATVLGGVVVALATVV